MKVTNEIHSYINSLPPDRKEDVKHMRSLILANLPDGYEEVIQYGMISYVIPLDRFPNTYNNQPLAYISLANQKNYISLYLMGTYSDADKRKKFEENYTRRGKKLNMGKSCLRFKSFNELPADLIAKTVAEISAEEFIQLYEKSRSG